MFTIISMKLTSTRRMYLFFYVIATYEGDDQISDKKLRQISIIYDELLAKMRCTNCTNVHKYTFLSNTNYIGQHVLVRRNILGYFASCI
ncbi:MAG: hypothetical protein ATN32_08860 [Candidatus Epulonipiscium fishelsonii]|nr:MAG: hypothetical protein ATN32_08860 [Epulopiscium sp. AS2M-Bin002]